MDRSLKGLYGSVDRFRLNDDTVLAFSGRNFDDGFQKETYVDIPPLQPAPMPRNLVPSSSVNEEGDSHEDYDFSDVVLKYINQMLMEEDMEDKTCMFKESSAALQAAEKSFYEVLGQRYPHSPKYELKPFTDQNQESFDDSHDQSCWRCSSASISSSSSNLVDLGCSHDLGEQRSSSFASQANSQSSHSSGNSTGSVLDGFVDSPVSTLRLPEIFSDSESAMQFRKGFEEASRFLPNGQSLFVDVESDGLFLKEVKEEAKGVVDKAEKNEFSQNGSRGKKNPYPEDVNLESGRSNKQSAVYTGSTVSSEMFDKVLLNCQSVTDLRKALQDETSKNVQQSGQLKGSTGGKARGKKQGSKRNVVDLRTLLTLCAQAVASDDRRSANELLKQIRQHSSPMGDGMQRMAHYFVDGLEARLAGSGTQIYTALITKPTSAADVLKAYHLFLAACPFRKLSNFFSNKTIMNLAENAPRLHIIDFGILYGFQWPCLIRRLSSRPGGPPKLRITGIDLPQPGFRPAERVEETGLRLANYAETFKVPFEFHAIAQKWDTIQIEDLRIDSDEVLVVNCMYRLRNLLDETVVVESPRNKVLNLIRKMNPDVFILGIVNGACNAPFFITRFREALFHYSTLFDMLETNVPREIPERMLIEREIFGWEAMNVIACEGAERIERLETYKQWQVRISRAGLRQLPLNEEIMKTAKERVDTSYHKDFVIDEDNRWLLQGWKGRIVYALSSWVPAS
ncbi:Transcription factor GRAS - like 9 [Theobroma cacao]|uniref:GRAS family transcription factor isoform 1 n=1 Tax=Theobroma cacao TaxID=3641 RepID=A0A061FL45_THECC|nr:GRAS family transcription factor isoform 1 [Theobroma cacao]EOY18045.1 GRAS family transcription factor isoform 1 [Theobroma cacao]WRX12009.1 Transcription factor GRAS - like 9 [Theobroma cacao]